MAAILSRRGEDVAPHLGCTTTAVPSQLHPGSWPAHFIYCCMVCKAQGTWKCLWTVKSLTPSHSLPVRSQDAVLASLVSAALAYVSESDPRLELCPAQLNVCYILPYPFPGLCSAAGSEPTCAAPPFFLSPHFTSFPLSAPTPDPPLPPPHLLATPVCVALCFTTANFHTSPLHCRVARAIRASQGPRRAWPEPRRQSGRTTQGA